MSSDAKLYSVEDSLKKEHYKLISQMSRVELKQFRKYDYKTIVFDEITALLPDVDKERLDQTSLCIVNFLASEVQSLISRTTRESISNTPALLSSTVLDDFDTTLSSTQDSVTDSQPDANIVQDSEVTDAVHDTCDESNHVTHDGLNDSITKLKQVANAEAKPSNPHSENKPGLKNPKKCSDACKIKSSAKKQYSMIQCSFCMVWLHEKCVGISEGDQIGLWLCLTCRSIPPAIKHDIGTLKTDVEQLKECTKSILSAVKGLSEKVENSFGSLNDRLTSLNRNINAKDLTLSESLESISSSTNSLKTVLVYECRAPFGSINTILPTMTITKRLGITLTPLRLHAASTVRIPHSTNNFQNLLPTVRVTPLNLFSASTVNLHGASNSNMFRNNLQIRLSPLKSPILRKYINPFKRPGMYPSISKCNAKKCNCCNHLCSKTTITSSVNGRTFSVVNDSDLD